MDYIPNDPMRTCSSGNSEAWQTIKFILQLGYVLPFGVLSIWILIRIAKRKKKNDIFNDSYFNIYFADGIVFWKTYINKIVVIVVLIFPVCLMIPILFTQTFLYVYIGKALIIRQYTQIWARVPYLRLIVGIPSLIFIIFSNVFTISKLSKLNHRLKSIEVSMCIATAFLSIGFVAIICIQIILAIYPIRYLYYMPELANILLVINQLCDDFHKLSGPILLLTLDKKVRRAVFRRGPVNINTSAIVHSIHPLFSKGSPTNEYTNHQTISM